MNRTVEQVVDELRSLRSGGRRLVVGIDGFGGSGKSTVAREIADRLRGAVVIGMDDFILKDRVDDPDWEGVWDRARLLREVITPFSAGEPIRYRRLEWVSNELSAPIEVPSSSVLVVEGITALHEDLRDRYDYSIWIDAPIDVASARGRARDAGNENEHRWGLWSRNDLAYRDRIRPRDLVDAVIDTW